MARLARIDIPDVAHHVTQRGNRRLPVFFCDEDRTTDLALLGEAARACRTTCLACCLMDNHVYVILVPQGPDGLCAMLSSNPETRIAYPSRPASRAIKSMRSWKIATTRAGASSRGRQKM